MGFRDERGRVGVRHSGSAQTETRQIIELEEDLLSPLRSREGWASFVRAAAALPSLDFRNQLRMARQIERRQSRAEAFATESVWAEFKCRVRSDAEPFYVMGKHRWDYGLEGSWVRLYERWQVDGLNAATPDFLQVGSVNRTWPEGFADRVKGFAQRRGMTVIERPLEDEAARLVRDAMHPRGVALVNSEAPEEQQARGLVGVVVNAVLLDLKTPGPGSPLNPFIASAIRHIVLASNDLAPQNAYRGPSQVPWPTDLDLNKVQHWGEVTSIVANGLLAATAKTPHRALSPDRMILVSRDTQVAAKHHDNEYQRLLQSGGRSSPPGPMRFVELVNGDRFSLIEALAAQQTRQHGVAESGGSATPVSEYENGLEQ